MEPAPPPSVPCLKVIFVLKKYGKTKSYHEEAPAHPQFLPSDRTLRDFARLAVDCYGFGRRLTDRTSGYVFLYVIAVNGGHSHWDRFCGGQPETVIVSVGVVADVVQVTEQERHGAERSDATSRSPCTL